MANITPRGNSFRAAINIQGVRETKTFRTKPEATLWAAQVEAEILAKTRGKQIKRTAREMLVKYRDEITPSKGGAREEANRINFWLRELPFLGMLTSEVQPPQIGEWRDARLKTVSSSSVRRELNTLSAVFNYARREWRWHSTNPCSDIWKPEDSTPRNRRVTEAESDMIIAALAYRRGELPTRKSHEVAIAFLIGIETAMRAGEILKIEESRCRFELSYVELPTTKNGDPRLVPLSPRAKELLKLMVDSPLRTGARLFTVDNSSRSVLFSNAVKKSGIDNLHFHDGRAEALTRLSKKVDVMTLGKISGHRDINILFNTYYRESATDIAARLV